MEVSLSTCGRCPYTYGGDRRFLGSDFAMLTRPFDTEQSVEEVVSNVCFPARLCKNARSVYWLPKPVFAVFRLEVLLGIRKAMKEGTAMPSQA
ncbi:MAG: hypothetical protein ACYCVY_11775, partial [Acidiferrobacteraceae bacterium]